jgi:hypothetical protein
LCLFFLWMWIAVICHVSVCGDGSVLGLQLAFLSVWLWVGVFCHVLNMVLCRRDVGVDVKIHSETLKIPQETNFLKKTRYKAREEFILDLLINNGGGGTIEIGSTRPTLPMTMRGRSGQDPLLWPMQQQSLRGTSL